MTTKEKLYHLTDEQLERFKCIIELKCDDISCLHCIFHNDTDRCLAVSVFDECIRRETAE